jgi:hypothetical protein
MYDDAARLRLVPLALLLITTVAAAQPAPDRMVVTGCVLDPEGKTVPNATVMVHAALKQPGLGRFGAMSPTAIGRARSDGSGRFRLDAIRTTSARHHRVGAVSLAPGYGAGWVELDPDADRPAADITLRPEQVIEGRLFDLGGRPVRDVEVTVQAMIRVVPSPLAPRVPDFAEGPSFLTDRVGDLPAWPRPAFSDADGRFTLRGVGRGIRVLLGVNDPRFARLRTPVDTEGTSRVKSVTMALEPARIIAGRVVVADTDRPIPHARLLVLSYKGRAGLANEFEADDQGRFRMNPLSADRYSITASPPPGPPYLDTASSYIEWPRGAVEHRLDLALRRGVVIRGRVVEEGSEQPVAGARISYGARRAAEQSAGATSGRAETSADGSFRITVLPAPGYLIVLAPSEDYVYREIGDGPVREGRPGGRRFYVHAFVACDPKPDVEGPEVTVPIRRSQMVKGRVVGPDGRPIPSATMISRGILPPTIGAWRFWRYDRPALVRDGRFEIHGLDPDAEVPVHFFEPKAMLGATAMLSGRSGSGGPVTVRLEPCGTARARLVDRDGKPVAGYRGSRLISMIVTPGADRFAPEQPGQLAADEAGVLAIDPAHYANPGPVSDADGRIALPALIPGATYRVSTGPRGVPPSFRKEFTVRPGETVDLGEIVVQRLPE